MSEYTGNVNASKLLSENWGAEEGLWSGAQVQAGIKDAFNNKVGFYTLVGKHIMGFASEEDYNTWNEAEEKDDSLVLSDVTLNIDELSRDYNIKLLGTLNGVSLNSGDTIDVSAEKCSIKEFGLLASKIDGTEIDESTPLIYSIKIGDTVVKSGSMKNGNVLADDIDLKNFISKTNSYLSISVQIMRYTETLIVPYNLNDLSIEFLNEEFWGTPIEFQNEGNLSFYLNGTLTSGAKGNIHISIHGYNKSYDMVSEDITSLYANKVETVSLEGIINDAKFTEGNYVLEAYLKVGNNESAHITKNVLVVRNDSTSRYICANLENTSFNNYVQSDICKFFVFNANTTDVNPNPIHISLVAKVVTDYVVNTTDLISDSYLHKVSGIFNYETELNEVSGSVTLIMYEMDGINLVDTGIKFLESFTLTNSSPFKQAVGASIVIDPINQLSGDDAAIKNSASTLTRTIDTVWTNMLWSKNDGWLSGSSTASNDYEKLNSLKVLRNSKVSINTNFIDNDSFTLELYYKVFNTVDSNAEVIYCRDGNASTFNGLSITKNAIVFNPSGAITVKRNSLMHNSENLTHLTIVYNSNFNRSGKPITKLYINGKIAREMDGFITSQNISGLVVGSIGADVAIYKVRKYTNIVLSDLEVFLNFLNCNYVNATERIALNTKNSEIFADNKITPNNLTNYNYFILKYNLGEGETKADYKYPLPNWDEPATVGNVSLELHWDKVNFPGNEDVIIGGNVTEGEDGTLIIEDYCSIEGLGSSSKKYYRWNWRIKTLPTPIVMKTKNGLYGVTVKRLTAKKNTASSMHSHKMGFINSYLEIYDVLSAKDSVIVVDEEIGYSINLDYANLKTAALLSNSATSDKNHRVAMWQAPFFGFAVNAEGGYDFVGLYTLGPDKGDESVSGFDTKTYTNMFEIEGSEQEPKLQNFAEPWEENSITYDSSESMTSTIYNTADGFEIMNPSKKDNGKELLINNLNETFRCVFDHTVNIKHCANEAELHTLVAAEENSLYWLHDDNASKHKLYWVTDLADESLHEWKLAKHDVAEARTTAYWSGSDYWTLEGTRYVHQCYLEDFVTGVTLPASPTEEDYEAYNKACLTQRANHFAKVFADYFNAADTLIWLLNIEIHDGSDEAAKNIYPYKMNEGTDNKWRWRIDDTDTRLDINNLGACILKYNIQCGDNYSIYGNWPNNSFLMGLLNSRALHKVKALVFKDTIDAMLSLGTGTSTRAKLLDFYNRHFWKNSADYFGEMGYNKDAEFTYDAAYLTDDSDNKYDGVPPLNQSLGDKKISDLEFIINRISFLSRKYSIIDSLYSNLNLGRSFTGDISYTIDEADYPSYCKAMVIAYFDKRYDSDSEITCTINASGQSNSYVYNMGNIKKLTLNGSNSLDAISISGCPKMTELDLSNYSTVYSISNLYNIEKLNISNNQTIASANIKLDNSLHLDDLNAGNTLLDRIILPSGASTTKLNLPSSCKELYIDNLKGLKSTGITIDGSVLDFSKFDDVYVVNCNKELNPLDKLLTAVASGKNYSHIYLSGLNETWNTRNSANNITNLKKLVASTGIHGYALGKEYFNPSNSTKLHLEGDIVLQANYFVNDLLYINNNIDGSINFDFGDNSYSAFLKFNDTALNNYVLNYLLENNGDSENNIIYEEFLVKAAEIAKTNYSNILATSTGDLSDFGSWFENLVPQFLKGNSILNLNLYIRYTNTMPTNLYILLDYLRPAKGSTGAYEIKKLYIEGKETIRIAECTDYDYSTLSIKDFVIKAKAVQFRGDGNWGNYLDIFTNIYLNVDSVPTFKNNDSYTPPTILSRSENVYVPYLLYWDYVLNNDWKTYLERDEKNFTPYNFTQNKVVSIPDYLTQFSSHGRIFAKSGAVISSENNIWLKHTKNIKTVIHFATFTLTGNNRYLYGNLNFKIYLNNSNNLCLEFKGKSGATEVERTVIGQDSLAINKEYVAIIWTNSKETMVRVTPKTNANINEIVNIDFVKSTDGYPTAIETPLLIGSYNSYIYDPGNDSKAYEKRLTAYKGNFIGEIFGVYLYQFDYDSNEFILFDNITPTASGFTSNSGGVSVTLLDNNLSIYQ